jgi:catechol 2,3-dioxygenase-like lactoylglutathione lyase family enzyme
VTARMRLILVADTNAYYKQVAFIDIPSCCVALAMIKVGRISHATFQTPDLSRAIDYFTQVIGLAVVESDTETAYLATKTGLLAIALERGAAARCRALTFELGGNQDIDAVRRHLSDHDLAYAERRDAAPGIAHAISFRDPNETTIELFSGIGYVDARRDVLGIGALKLGHVAFFTRDPRALVEFYQRLLGFRVSDWIADFFVFMRCNADHHTVNFVRGDIVGMHHIAFELEDTSQVASSCDLLARERIAVVWGPLRLGPGHNVAAFHRNHDRHVVEFYAELDQMKDEALGYFDPRPWHRDRPQRPKVWGAKDDAIWGPPAPPGFRSSV